MLQPVKLSIDNFHYIMYISGMPLAKKIAEWIKEKVDTAGAVGCVLGLSGGIDSAVAAVLAKSAFPKSTQGLLLPCHSHKGDLADAAKLAKQFGIETKLVDLTLLFESAYLSFEGKTFNEKEKNLAIANLKPRLRMLALYYFANKLNYLVIGTGNKSEIMMGYFTKYGDGGVDLLPLGGLLKTEVKKLAKELNIPKEIIDKHPSAGLWPGQTDEAEMGISYAELDQIIQGKTSGIDPRKTKMVEKRIKNSEHKRLGVPIFNA